MTRKLVLGTQIVGGQSSQEVLGEEQTMTVYLYGYDDENNNSRVLISCEILVKMVRESGYVHWDYVGGPKEFTYEATIRTWVTRVTASCPRELVALCSPNHETILPIERKQIEPGNACTILIPKTLIAFGRT